MSSREDPDWFCENILRSPNDKWQSELMQAVADVWRKKNNEKTRFNHKGLNMVTVRSCHNPGKTHWIAKCMHWFNFCFPGRVVATAPKEDQLKTRLWPEFRKVRNSAINDYRKITRVDATKIVWANDPDWVALAETASAGENLAGHHWDFLLIVIDEASGVKEELFPVIEGAMGTGKLVVLLMIGNPTRTQGTFYESHMRERVAKHYYKKHVKPSESPRVDKNWIKKMEDKYGKNSPVVKVRCYGEFCETEKDQLIALEWLVNQRNAEWKSDGSIPRFRVTCDVADGGEDETIVTGAAIYDTFIVLLKQTRHSDPPAESPILAADHCEQMFKDIGASKKEDDIVVDSIGVGAGTAGTLLRRGYNVIRYKGGETVGVNTKLYRNRRSQSYIVCRNYFRDGMIFYEEDFCDEDDWEDYTAQMCSIKRRPGVERVEEVVPKEEMLRGGLKSPDMSDGTSMMFATQTPDSRVQVDTAVVIQRDEPAYAEAI